MLTLGDSDLVKKFKSYFYLKVIEESTRTNETNFCLVADF